MKIAKKTLLALFVVFIAMQFYRPHKNIAKGNHTKSLITETNPSQEVKILLEKACYDCHSNNTEYSWHNNIAPVSYWLANHIDQGKDHLNFSEWDSLSVNKKDHKLEEIVDVLKDGVMPLKVYTWMHEEANLTNSQKESIIEWANKSKVLYQLNQQPQ